MRWGAVDKTSFRNRQKDHFMKKFSIIMLTWIFLSGHISALAQTKGPATGFPLPRFVSLKSNRVNLRVGPGRKYSVQWLYVKPGLPVEIIMEFERWRRIRDSEGTEGWVFHSLLSGKRTAIITPWDAASPPVQTDKFANIHASSSLEASVVAKLQPGVIVKIKNCKKDWCEVATGNVSGYVQKPLLWGVYPGEVVKG